MSVGRCFPLGELIRNRSVAGPRKNIRDIRTLTERHYVAILLWLTPQTLRSLVEPVPRPSPAPRASTEHPLKTRTLVRFRTAVRGHLSASGHSQPSPGARPVTSTLASLSSLPRLGMCHALAIVMSQQLTATDQTSNLVAISAERPTHTHVAMAMRFLESCAYSTTAVLALAQAIRLIGEGASEFDGMAKHLEEAAEKIAKLEASVI